jgi:hypothetical protein
MMRNLDRSSAPFFIDRSRRRTQVAAGGGDSMRRGCASSVRELLAAAQQEPEHKAKRDAGRAGSTGISGSRRVLS